MAHETNPHGYLVITNGFELNGSTGSVEIEMAVFQPRNPGGVTVIDIEKTLRYSVGEPHFERLAMELSSEDRIALANYLLEEK